MLNIWLKFSPGRICLGKDSIHVELEFGIRAILLSLDLLSGYADWAGSGSGSGLAVEDIVLCGS